MRGLFNKGLKGRFIRRASAAVLSLAMVLTLNGVPGFGIGAWSLRAGTVKSASAAEKKTVTDAADSTKPIFVKFTPNGTIPAGKWGSTPTVELTQYDVSLVNNSASVISDWTITIKCNKDIHWNAGWNGAACNGNTITIGTYKGISQGDNEVWNNQTVAAGESANGAGFQAATGAIDGAEVTVSYDEGASDEKPSLDESSGSSSGGDSGSSGGSSSFDGENIGTIDTSTNYNFAKLLQLSLYFYDANMCGEGVEEHSLFSKTNNGDKGWRGNCHVHDSFTYNGKEYDSTGGYHDAGDHVKFGLPAAEAFTTLGMGYYEFRDAFTELHQSNHLKTITDYYTAWVNKCTVWDGDKVVALCYQNGHGQPDHESWTSPETEDESKTDRTFDLVATKDNPATDIVSETASALALNYLNFGNKTDLKNAEGLFAFAKENGKAIAKVDGSFYGSGSWADDYTLAAALLYQCTKKEVYKTEYDANKSLLASGVSQPWGWDHVEQGAYIFAPDGPDLSRVNDMVAGAANGSKNSYYCHDSWGSARINCNVQLIAMILDKLTDKDAYADWAKYQMSLILGGNSTGKNLVCGYNEKSPKNPHHRAASGFSGWDQFNSNAPEKYTLYGALCGGPTSTDFSTYQDKVNDSTSNEVTLDYNAGMVGAAAALYLKNKKSTDKGLSEQMTITGLPGMSSDAKIYGYKDGKAVDPDAKPEEIIEPSEDPTAEPTAEPTLDPGNTTDPTLKPTEEPSASPSVKPTEEPSANPSVMPTAEPTLDPTAAPDTPAPTPVTPTASPAPSSDPNISDTITILDSNDLSKYQSKTTASAGTGSSGQGQTAGTGTSSGTESSASAGIPKGVPVIVNNYTTVVNYNYTPDTMVVGSDTDNYYVNIKVRGAGVIPVKKIYTSAPKKTFSIYKLPAGAKVTSSNKKAVKVLKNGRLKTGKRGRSKITIQTGGAAYSFTVKVNRSAIKKVRFTSKLKRLKTGKRVRLSAKTLLGRKYTRGNLIFKVNAANRADILADGTLSAKSKGIVKVTAYATDGSGRRAVMKVRII